MTARARLLFSSNSMWTASGYGTQAASLLPRLAELPEFDGGRDDPKHVRSGRANVAQFAWYGLQSGTHYHQGFRIYPAGNDPYGNDVIGAYMRHFGGSILVTLIDAWVLQDVAKKIAPALYCPWFPCDHDELPQRVIDGIAGAHMPLTYSKWGHDQCLKAGIPNTYIPHGIETNIFRVIPRENALAFKRAVTGIDNAHLSIMVAANKGFPDRKWFQGQLRAWAEFAKDKPHAFLYIHTEPSQQYGGIDFAWLTNKLGIQERVRFPDRLDNFLGLPQEYLALVYNAADVLLSCSMSEGFGIPIIEAQAAGTPVVVTDFSAMPELVRWGHKVRVADWWLTPMNAYQAWPDVHDMTDKLNQLYEAWEICGGDWPLSNRLAVSKLIHEEYSWDIIVRDQWAPLITKLADEAPPLDARFQVAGVAAPPTERSVEIPWLVANLGKPKRILDVGSRDATYVKDLVATGAEVTLCDTQPFPAINSVWQWIGSAAEMPAEWTGRFDLVTCVSVLDHVGLEAYGNAADDTLLERTVAELARVTAPGGRLLLTVPFGRDQVTTHPGGGQRIFGLEELNELLSESLWDVGDVSCWRLQNERYEPVAVESATDAEYDTWRAQACIAVELVRVGASVDREAETRELPVVEPVVPVVPRRRVAPLVTANGNGETVTT